MHELSIAENIIKIVSSSYKGEKENIKSIIVNVGELTGIQPES
ncbi:MAG: hydrogenase maturation nickel metallochaperone HypA, partial [Bacteroidales bacterium]|nr:hydrogenase maturation nickel metallochaperone HypA [Bacteroidales bacterium]